MKDSNSQHISHCFEASHPAAIAPRRVFARSRSTQQEHPSTQRSELSHNSSHNSSVELIMGLRLSIVGGALVAKSARALLRPPAVARRAITTKRTDWAGEARSVCQGATEDKLEALGYALPPASTPKGSYAMYSRERATCSTWQATSPCAPTARSARAWSGRI